MKHILIAGAVAALCTVGFAGTASAFQPGTPQCFGQVHKAVNSGALAPTFQNVGQLVQAAGGQGKSAAAAGFCVPG